MNFPEGAAVSVSMNGVDYTDINEISTFDSELETDREFKSFNDFRIEGSFDCTVEDPKEFKKFLRKLTKLPRKKKKLLYGRSKDRRRILRKLSRGESVKIYDLKRIGFFNHDLQYRT